MDEKGRVSLPSAFRRGNGDDRFVLLQWEPSYLTLFPDEVWQDIQARLLEFRRTQRGAAWHHVREMIARAVEVSPDKQGRILVPAGLQQGAGLAGSVLVNGNLDRVELWDPQTYRDTVEQAAGDDLAHVAHELFG